jgi:enterochelin esterase family protein
MTIRHTAVAALLALAAASPAAAQSESCLPKAFLAPPAAYKSVEQLADGRVTFRLCAPAGQQALVVSNDIDQAIPMGFRGPRGLPMTKDATGLWAATTAIPVPADTYRFNFEVDGAPVPDPQGTEYSKTRVGLTSLFEVKGPAGEFQAFRPDIPHGRVAAFEYWSPALGVKRRAHIYTPPGYETGKRRYPVLYLVHGFGDSDDSWTSVGRAHYILDNLIAAGKAKPMIVVMPFAHTPERPGLNFLDNGDFGQDLLDNLIPAVDREYRTLAVPDSRAMAGLSMGGAHTIRFGLTHPDKFGYIGIFSIGLGSSDPQEIARYEAQNGAALNDGAKAFKLVYYAIGKDDFLYSTSAPTRAMLDRHKIKFIYNESAGGHTWINWRRYLADFAPRLFGRGEPTKTK